MSTRELIEWEAFEEDFGPMTVHERIDAAVAILAHQQALHHAAAQGVELHTPVTDFLPQWESETEGEGPHITDWLSAMAKRP